MNLVGTDDIAPDDCDEVREAVLATEMPAEACQAVDVPLCPNGQPVNTMLFNEGFENGIGNWTISTVGPVLGWYVNDNYAASGQYSIYGWDITSPLDASIAMNTGVTLPANSPTFMHFKHAYDFEGGGAAFYDGGVVEYSTTGLQGPWIDAGHLFMANGYRGTLSTYYGNPLGSRQAFSNTSTGYLSSSLDLSTLTGSTIRFRFRFGTDSSIRRVGWYIDDVRIYTCSP